MQLGSVYLYPNRIDVYANVDLWVHERYRKVYQRNLKVYRGVDNRIEFRVKSSDQKPVNITNKTVVFRLIARETQELLIKKDCESLDPATGKIFLMLTQNEMLEIEPSMYQYSLSYEVREINGNYHTVTESYPIYVDSQYGASGIMEVFPGIAGEAKPSSVVEEFKHYNVYDSVNENFIISGIFPAYAQMVTSDSTHTFQLYFTNFSGRVVLQASLDNGGDPQTWVDINSFDYIDVSQEYINVVGLYKWFRFKITPSDAGLFGDFQVNQTIFGNYNVTIRNTGKLYSAGNVIVIKGDRLGGETPGNDLTITVNDVDLNGSITSFTYSGRSMNGVSVFNIDNSGKTNIGSIDKILYR